MALADEHVKSLPEGTSPLTLEEVDRLLQQIPQWRRKEKMIDRSFEFKDFVEAMVFVNKVAEFAQQENHHPEIIINYNKVHIELSTHKIGGLSRNDFILAAKIDKILS